MYAAFYRWRLKPGSETPFANLWKQGTLLFKQEHQALGSRLHKADDGTYFAYAQWPGRDIYHSERILSDTHKQILEKMKECIEESFAPILGAVESDLLE